MAHRHGLLPTYIWQSITLGCSNAPANSCSLPHPDKFCKGRSQEKIHILRLEFFLLPSPPVRARSVLNCRAMYSGGGHCDPAVWIFSNSGFHCFFAAKPVVGLRSGPTWNARQHGDDTRTEINKTK